VWVLTAILMAASLSAPADAASPKIHSFTKLCSGSITYTVIDLSQPLMPGTQTCSFALKITTGANPGSITLSAPAILGTTGTISSGAWWATCTASSDPAGIFSSSGSVQLTSAGTTCATISSNQINQSVSFNVALFLDDTPDSTSFPGDPGYGSSNLAVTANAP